MSNVPNYDPSKLDTLYGIFRQIIKSYLTDNVDTASIVTVQAVNEDGSLNVLPVLNQLTTTGEILKNAEVANVRPFYFVGGGCEISFPIAAGDYGLLIACKFDGSGYIQTHISADIASFRQFDNSNGVFLPFDFVPSAKTGVTIKKTTENATDSIVMENDVITITHAGAKNVTLTISDSGLTITTDAPLSVTADSATVTASGTATITAATVNLGGEGGPGVARIGDTVNLSTGLITGGSGKVFAA